jgi:hypothetical protein
VRSTAEGITEFAPVNVNIKPGSDPNCVGVQSEGVTPIAILGSDVDVTEIDVGTLEIDDDKNQATPGVKPTRWSADEDVNGDGEVDLMLHFNTEDLRNGGLLIDQSELTITGNMNSGTLLLGSDILCVVPQ